MALQWTTEEYTLLNIRKCISNGWRMNRSQLYEYGKKLQRARERVLPGELGSAFADAVSRIADGHANISWTELLKDTELMQKLLQGSRQWDRDEWLKRLSGLEARQEKYFRTQLGAAFIQTLKIKLGICKEKQQPVQKTDVQAAAGEILQLEGVAAWLMQDTDLIRTEQKKKASQHVIKLPGGAAAAVCACISFCLLSAWLYGQFERNQNVYDIHKLKAASAPAQEAYAEKTENRETAHTAKASDKTPETKLSAANPKQKKQDTQQKRPKILAQYQEMAKEYPGLFGWLQIPDTQIDLPVMQPLKEKDFYLNHDFTGAESAEGALFADPKNNRWPQDGNTVIYGHNMKNGHIFGELDLYEDPDYFQKHKEIHFDTIYETGQYEAVAVIKTRILNENEQGFRYYQFFQYDNKKQFQQCAEFVKENQLFDTGSSLRYHDRILMLSTCEYSQENGRLVIVARKIA